MAFPNFSKNIDQALNELAIWRDSNPNAAKYSPEFYNSIEKLLQMLSEANGTSEFMEIHQLLVRQLVDSGPLDSQFLPSLHAVGEALSKQQMRMQR